VTIVPSPGYLGACVSYKPPKWVDLTADGSWRIAKWTQEKVVILFAGGAAEAKFKGRANYRGSSSDYEHATALAMAVCGSSKQAEKYLAWLVVVAQDLVSSPVHWPLIEALAEELLTQKTLNGKKAEAIIRARISGAKLTAQTR